MNDVTENGKTTQKDTAILQKRFLARTKPHKAMRSNWFGWQVKNGFDGIEIDYEKIRKDLDLWQAFLKFEEKTCCFWQRMPG